MLFECVTGPCQAGVFLFLVFSLVVAYCHSLVCKRREAPAFQLHLSLQQRL